MRLQRWRVKHQGAVDIQSTEPLPEPTACMSSSRTMVLPQVCVRSSGPVRVALGGSVLEQNVPSSFNAVLLCEDVQLDHGRVPISVHWASTPNSVQTLLQLWVVSVSHGAQLVLQVTVSDEAAGPPISVLPTEHILPTGRCCNVHCTGLTCIKRIRSEGAALCCEPDALRVTV